MSVPFGTTAIVMSSLFLSGMLAGASGMMRPGSVGDLESQTLTTTSATRSPHVIPLLMLVLLPGSSISDDVTLAPTASKKR
jgi:hypothetical protein